MNSFDEIDVERLKQREIAVWEALVREESPRLFQFLLRFLQDEEEARNVMQEAFLQAFQQIDTFRGASRLTTWLYGIALNQAQLLLRKKRRSETLGETDLDRLQPAFSRGMYLHHYRPCRLMC